MCVHSEQINELPAALAKAQGEIEGAELGRENTYFHQKYATLHGVWEACRGPLSKHGLSIIQSPSADGARVTMHTMLLHSSGQWVSGEITAQAKDATPQSIGSCVTYLRRYHLQSFAGVAPDDDDGEAAQPPRQEKPKAAAKPPAAKAPPAPERCKEFIALGKLLQNCRSNLEHEVTPAEATAIINWAVAGVGDFSGLRMMAAECKQIFEALESCGLTGPEIYAEAVLATKAA